MTRLPTLLALALFAGACERPPMAQQQQPDTAPLRLEVRLPAYSLRVGESLQAEVRLQNTSDAPIELTFGSACALRSYIRDAGTGTVVHPEDGMWICAQVITTVALGPGETKADTLTIHGGARPSGLVGLTPGRYELWAEIEAAEHRMTSDVVNLRVQ